MEARALSPTDGDEVPSGESGFERIHELTEIASLLTSTFDVDQILSNLMDAALRLADAEVGSLWLKEDTLRTRVTWGLEESALVGLRLRGGETAPEFVTRTGELFWASDCRRDARIESLPADVEIGNLLCVPLRRKGLPIGCIAIANRASAVLEGAEEESLTALASFATVAIENARLHRQALEREKLDRELSTARQVQMALLPGSDPDTGGIQWASVYVPMGKVGGDYYDYVTLPDNSQGVVVADVSDKGVPAALFMAVTRNLVRREAQAGSKPAELLERVNRALCEDTERFASIFVTLFYGQYDAGHRGFEFVNAGHCQPLLLPREGDPLWLSARGTVLGQFEDTRFDVGCVKLAPGDLLVLYTDGVTETHSPEGEMYRRERLLDAVRSGRDLDCLPLALRIVEDVRTFANGAGLGDDLTVLVGRVQ